MRMLWMVIAVLAGLAIALVAVGALLPATTEATATRVLSAPVERVFATVTAVGEQPRWRSDVASVDVAADGTTWVERDGRGAEIAFRETERVPNAAFAVEFTSNRGFVGSWRGTFAADGAGTVVRFTERVTIANPLFRIVGRLLGGPGAFMARYLDSLEAAVKES